MYAVASNTQQIAQMLAQPDRVQHLQCANHRTKSGIQVHLNIFILTVCKRCQKGHLHYTAYSGRAVIVVSQVMKQDFEYKYTSSHFLENNLTTENKPAAYHTTIVERERERERIICTCNEQRLKTITKFFLKTLMPQK